MYVLNSHFWCNEFSFVSSLAPFFVFLIIKELCSSRSPDPGETEAVHRSRGWLWWNNRSNCFVRLSISYHICIWTEAISAVTFCVNKRWTSAINISLYYQVQSINFTTLIISSEPWRGRCIAQISCFMMSGTCCSSKLYICCWQ